MSVRFEELDDFSPFPQNRNLRITVEGLAICEFEPNTSNLSTISFLDHVRHHNLMLTVRRRKVGTTAKPEEFDLGAIGKKVKNINIDTTSTSGITNYKRENLLSGESKLDNIIHLTNAHKPWIGSHRRFRRNTKKAIKLNLKHCEFYIKTLTPDEYYLFTLDNPFPSGTKRLGAVIGAYMNVSESIKILIDGKEIFNKPVIESGHSYHYEMKFTNHCEESTEKCKDVIGNRGSDIWFLYDIIEPRRPPIYKVRLFKITFDKATGETIITPNIAACMPAQVSP